MSSHQGRYVMNHMYDGPYRLRGGYKTFCQYYLQVKDRREDELDNLAYYAGQTRISIVLMCHQSMRT